MLTKRIIPCLDVQDGRTVKGVNFVELKDAGDPVELAAQYAEQGADELVLLDISATYENRKTRLDLVKEIAREINIPFTIGGGIAEIADAEALLQAGADKVSINSAAYKNPDLIDELARQFGSQFVVVAIDTKNFQGIPTVYLRGGRDKTDSHTFDWARQAQERGAGEILLTSMDFDGTKKGFDIVTLAELNEKLEIPIIASGGAGNIEDFIDVFKKAQVDGALAASVFHYGEILIPELKKSMHQNGLPVRI